MFEQFFRGICLGVIPEKGNGNSLKSSIAKFNGYSSGTGQVVAEAACGGSPMVETHRVADC